MKKIFLLLFAAVCAIASWADEVTATYTSSKIDVALANTTEFVAFQMDIKADGVTFGTPELNSLRLNQEGSATIGGSSTPAPFVLASNVLADGTLRVIAYNLANRPLSLSEGNLFTVSVNGKPTAVTVSNVLFVKASDLAEVAVSAKAEEGADFIPGDVNGDNKVNSQDLTATVELILSGSYDAKADINHDTKVNTQDLTGIVEIIESQKH